MAEEGIIHKQMHSNLKKKKKKKLKTQTTLTYQQPRKQTNKQIKMLLQQHYSTTTEVAIDSVKNRVLAIKIFSMLYAFC